ncbi:MAG: hypothetical protein HN348_25715 [Proteobacteria bacterium]|jgi:hypothetical protein|nr:hypothetical protein [Pseudomonadota bacterium]
MLFQPPEPPDRYAEERLRLQWTVDGFTIEMREYRPLRMSFGVMASFVALLFYFCGTTYMVSHGGGSIDRAFGLITLIVVGLLPLALAFWHLLQWGFNGPLVTVRASAVGIEVVGGRIPWDEANIDIVHFEGHRWRAYLRVGGRYLYDWNDMNKPEQLRWLMACLEYVRSSRQRGVPKDVPLQLRQVMQPDKRHSVAH